MAKKIMEHKSLRSLKIVGLGMMQESIDQAWADVIANNLSIRNLHIKSSMASYGHGEKMFMALKRRKVRLESFIINNCLLID